MRRLIVAGILLLTACGDTSSTGDSDPPAREDIDDSPPLAVINMPDTFMNIAFKCMGVNGIYAHTREAAPVIIPNDPECKER